MLAREGSAMSVQGSQRLSSKASLRSSVVGLADPYQAVAG